MSRRSLERKGALRRLPGSRGVAPAPAGAAPEHNHRRESDGRYGYSADMTLPCVCGHPLGAHAGSNPGMPRPCLNEDGFAPMATGEPCDCQSFRRSSVDPTELCVCGHPRSAHPSRRFDRGLCQVCYGASHHGNLDYCRRFRRAKGNR